MITPTAAIDQPREIGMYRLITAAKPFRITAKITPAKAINSASLMKYKNAIVIRIPITISVY